MAVDVATKFVVLTTNRSGSVWVMSTLNSFPHVTAQGELFAPTGAKVSLILDFRHHGKLTFTEGSSDMPIELMRDVLKENYG